jgi:hypothetical protein
MSASSAGNHTPAAQFQHRESLSNGANSDPRLDADQISGAIPAIALWHPHGT